MIGSSLGHIGKHRAALAAAVVALMVLACFSEPPLIRIPAALVLGCAALTLLWALGQATQRADDARAAELAMREHEALTDELTGARNLRAFRQDLDAAAEHRSRSNVPLTVVMLDIQGLGEVKDSEGHETGDELLQIVAAAAAKTMRTEDGLYRLGSDDFALILAGTGRYGSLALVQRLHLELAHTEAPRRIAVTAGIAEAEIGESTRTLMRNADVALLHAKHSARGAEIYSPAMEREGRRPRSGRQAHHERTLATALARAVDAKDAYTRSHSETVSALCGMIGGELGLRPGRLDRLKLAGLLHDVGKIGISDAILQKPGQLTDEEFEVMKTHATIGHEIVLCAELENEADWVRHHHERIDGRGYPDGLADGDIPLESRVILVADAFEAMTSDRPYRTARPTEDALAELERGAGTQFDPACVGALSRALERDAPRAAMPLPAFQSS